MESRLKEANGKPLHDLKRFLTWVPQLHELAHISLGFFLDCILLIYLFSTALGLRRCTQAFFSCRERGLLCSCSAWASHCSGFSCCRVLPLGLMGLVVMIHGLQSPSSVVVAHRLSCPEACGVFLDQGLNPCPSYWQADS